MGTTAVMMRTDYYACPLNPLMQKSQGFWLTRCTCWWTVGLFLFLISVPMNKVGRPCSKAWSALFFHRSTRKVVVRRLLRQRSRLCSRAPSGSVIRQQQSNSKRKQTLGHECILNPRGRGEFTPATRGTESGASPAA